MPEIRYKELYDKGRLIKRDPYEVSDEALERERETIRLAEAITKDSLSIKGIEEIVKILIKRLLGFP